MQGFEDIVDAAPGDERDALWRSLAQDVAEAAAARRSGPGFVKATRPADIARALGRDRRAGLNVSRPLRAQTVIS